ncbi:OmpA family protein [Algoriphagus sp. D3-2-R+10]|uniref:OmpA family protein n=1 Tax=Algoriphagus aurantiacus TaxID=3103948 RepID=UPI002B37FA80|nr:OmpA family protein [Algoriphagus sp. D3-2-R+10]MEB2773679.1 OmpA family protein [Algoriphagus sp. D3-2-R+10]
MRKKLILTITFLLCFAAIIQAQNSKLRYADRQMQGGNYQYAAEIYANAFQKGQKYIIARNAAQCYDKLNAYKEALDWWEKVMAFEESRTEEDVVLYLRAARSMGRKEEMSELLQKVGYSASDFTRQEIHALPVSQGPNAGQLEYADSLNSEATDYMGAKDSEGNIYFVSDRGIKVEEKAAPSIRFDTKNQVFAPDYYRWTGRGYLRIFRKGKGGEVKDVVLPSNDFLHVSDPSIMQKGDETILFFSATRNIRKVRKNKDFTVHPEIFYGRLNEEGHLESYHAFPYNDSLRHAMITPHVDPSSGRLYFASDMDGGYGGFDLYYVEYTDDMDFSTPVNLGDLINTEGDERDPHIYHDSFYYASNGFAGYGGLDIYKAEIQSGPTLSGPVNLGESFNSSRDDFAYRQFDENEIYISSNRKENSGLDDIYKLVPPMRTLLVRVVDCQDNIVSDASIGFSEKDGKQLALDKNDKEEYVANLADNQNYEIVVDKPGYFSVVDKGLTTVDAEVGLMIREYRLTEIPKDLKVYADVIYYDLDKSMLRDDSDGILEEILELMNSHPFLMLNVSSHTDSRASNQYNEELSRRRAEAVVSYLSHRGIDKSRIAVEWHGESELARNCPDGVKCPEGEHQLNRRTELTLSIGNRDRAEDKLDMEKMESLCDLVEMIQKLGIVSNMTLKGCFECGWFDKTNPDHSSRDKSRSEEIHQLNSRTEIKVK